MDIQTIHESLINGQKKQMVEQRDQYGDTFWQNYKTWLEEIWTDGHRDTFADVVISYNKIKEGSR